MHIHTYLPLQTTILTFTSRFPLFAKGSEKALFQYAVFLLNKNIAQVNQELLTALLQGILLFVCTTAFLVLWHGVLQ